MRRTVLYVGKARNCAPCPFLLLESRWIDAKTGSLGARLRSRNHCSRQRARSLALEHNLISSTGEIQRCASRRQNVSVHQIHGGGKISRVYFTRRIKKDGQSISAYFPRAWRRILHLFTRVSVPSARDLTRSHRGLLAVLHQACLGVRRRTHDG